MKQIHGVELIQLKVNVDDRGYLAVAASAGRSDAPHVKNIKEVYFLGNFSRGTIRGFHKHAQLTDHFCVSQGAAKFVLVDDRKDSPTYKEINTFIISSRSPALLVVPTNVYHGWMSLEEKTEVISIADQMYNKDKPDEVRIPPDSFGDVWTIKGR